MNKNYNTIIWHLMNCNKKFNKKVVFIFYFLLFTFFCSAQDSIRISGQFLNNTQYTKVVIRQFGIGSQDIAAVLVDKETGMFSITAPMDILEGIYRFQYSQAGGDYVDVILNGKEKEVHFAVDVEKEATRRMVHFTKSAENIAFQNYEQKRKALYQELEVLDGFINVYPNKKDAFYLSAIKERKKKVQIYQQFRTNFIKTTPFYFAKGMAVFSPYLFPNPLENYRLQDFYRHENFWEGKTTTDPLLLNTPLYTDAILNYLQYYMNPDIGFSEEEMNAGFKKCVDTIMNRFSRNEKITEFAIKYLQMGFKELGNEKVLQYIDEQYAIAQQCTSDDKALQKRLKGYEALKVGNIAPEIVLTSNDGTTKTLKDFPHEAVVVVFWASWCPHCMEEMPKLQEWAKNNPSTLVLAVSLDDEYTAFQNAIKDFPNMLHNCDLQKWKGQIVSDYFVAATPTIIVLDQERNILGKYANFSAWSAP